MPRARVRERPSQVNLSIGEPPDRLAGLLRVHKQLLDRIARRKQDRARLLDDAQALSAELTTRLAPLVPACAALDDEIHALFATLLAPGRLAARRRKAVERQYLVLQNDGVITPQDGSSPSSDVGDCDHEPDASGHDAEPPSGSGGFTAARPGKAGPIESLRAFYRRLATAIHPDKVQDETERTRRTEIMKEVTRAYGSGDLARLIEIERLWTGGAPLTAGDDPSDRCATLERTIGELRVQLRGLDAELRGLRRSPEADLVRHLRTGGDPVAELVAEAEAGRDDLVRIRDHLRAFECGKLSFADFMEGPASTAGDDAELLRQAAAALEELDAAVHAPRRRLRTR